MPLPEFKNYQTAKCCKSCAVSRIDFCTGWRICQEKFIVNDEMVCDGWQKPEFVFSGMPEQITEESKKYKVHNDDEI